MGSGEGGPGSVPPPAVTCKSQLGASVTAVPSKLNINMGMPNIHGHHVHEEADLHSAEY